MVGELSTMCFSLDIMIFTFVNQLDNLVSENSAEVDWRRSFYLNLIAHTSFTVTVAICRYFASPTSFKNSQIIVFIMCLTLLVYFNKFELLDRVFCVCVLSMTDLQQSALE